MYNKMPLPCTKCKEWGHDAYHCKGAGKNGAFGKKYAPVYCTNCEEWTWHGRNNRNCPINQGNYNNIQNFQPQMTKQDQDEGPTIKGNKSKKSFFPRLQMTKYLKYVVL